MTRTLVGKVQVPYGYTPSKVYITSSNAATDRLGYESICDDIVHALGGHPRIIFSKVQRFEDVEALADVRQTDNNYTHENYYRFLYDDYFENEKAYLVSMTTGKRPDISQAEHEYDGPGYVFRYGSSEDKPTGVSSQEDIDCIDHSMPSNDVEDFVEAKSENMEAEYFEFKERDFCSNTLKEERLSMYNGKCVYDTVIFTKPANPLERWAPDVQPFHQCIQRDLTQSTKEIVDVLFSDASSALHHVRNCCLPRAFSWHAINTGMSITESSCFGLYSNATTAHNVFDDTCTSRTFNSPGQIVYAYKAGIGDETETYGKKVYIRCSVLCNTVDTNATVYFIGPDHVSGNQCNIFIPTNSNINWYGNTSHFIYLNPQVDQTCTNYNANKIDVHVKVGTASGKIQIYGLEAWVVYNTCQ